MTDQEIVRAAAEARGWKVTAGHFAYGREWQQIRNADGKAVCDWNPLRSDADAMGLVDDLAQSGWYIRIERDEHGWRVTPIKGSANIMVCDREFGRAITLAYLRNKGVAA